MVYLRTKTVAGKDYFYMIHSVREGGKHKKIEQYRLLASVKRTLNRRPDLIKTSSFSDSEMKIFKKDGIYKDILAIKQRAERS